MSKTVGGITQVDESHGSKPAAQIVDANASSAKPGRGVLFQAGLLAAVLLPLLLLAVAVSIWNWTHIGDVTVDRGGYVALAIGIVATLGLGIGLMCLVFYSNNHNYDEDGTGS